MKNNNMLLTIATFPRSGQHFLKEHLIQRIGENGVIIESTHNINFNNSKTLTIIRNPIDSISSWVSMMEYFNEKDCIDDSIFIKNIQIAKSKYVNFYNYILEDLEIIIDYNFLNIDIENIIQYISKKINIVPNDKNILVNIKDDLNNKHVVSSKKLKKYETLFKLVNKMDMSKEFELYNKTLKKSYPNFISNVY